MTLKRGALGGAPLFAFMGGVYDLRRVPVRCEFDMATAHFAFLGIRIDALTFMGLAVLDCE